MQRHHIRTSIIAAAAMMVLILDSKTALVGAKEGVTLCLYTIIPSLFSFSLISMLLNNALMGRKLLFLRPLGYLCGIPGGSESILLLGLIGGYPVGAQCISQGYQAGQLTKHDAGRLLGFCNNAGPAFIFGMISAMFSNPAVVWILWLIHIISAIIVGILLPGKSKNRCDIAPSEPITVTQALNRTLKIMAQICGWVILLRIVICVLNRWVLWMLPQTLQVLVMGLLELSNGCCALYDIPSEGIRFIMASCLLAFGGFCVIMQTSSAVKQSGLGLYIPGKILQTIISLLISSIVQVFLFQGDYASLIPLSAGSSILTLCIFMVANRHKKIVAIQ